MQCPVCNVALVMSDRNGIEIDYCPQCRGVWLDRGELDKIIERSAAQTAPVAPVAPMAPQPQQYGQPHPQAQPMYQQPRHRDYDDDDDDDRYKHRSHDSYHGDSHHGHHKKKKEGFLGDLFDF